MIEETQKGVDQMKLKIGGIGDTNSFSQASSRKGLQFDKPPKNILVDDPPKSYRSGNLTHLQNLEGFESLKGDLTSRKSQNQQDDWHQ